MLCMFGCLDVYFSPKRKWLFIFVTCNIVMCDLIVFNFISFYLCNSMCMKKKSDSDLTHHRVLHSLRYNSSSSMLRGDEWP